MCGDEAREIGEGAFAIVRASGGAISKDRPAAACNWWMKLKLNAGCTPIPQKLVIRGYFLPILGLGYL